MIRSQDMRMTFRYYVGILALLCITPLVGPVYRDQPLAPYLEFPPTTGYIAHAQFSWPVFVGIALFVAAACLPFLYRLATFRPSPRQATVAGQPFPWWGRLGILMVAAFWIMAWNRFAFLAPLQRYTFFPLWLGYILMANALTYRRRGVCLLLSRPRFFLALFPVSMLFWWYFEYLNRFVRNWHYVGGGPVTAAEYVIHASICFSTVLPAFQSTREYLGTFPRLAEPFAGWRPVTLFEKRVTGVVLLGVAVSSLAMLDVFPAYLFPLVWIAPLLVVTGMQTAGSLSTAFTGLAQGDWRCVVLPALAALICGFFWETWNWHSLAHWQYSVPFVHRFQIFAMPLLGYAGYLPFGLECAAVAGLVREKIER